MRTITIDRISERVYEMLENIADQNGGDVSEAYRKVMGLGFARGFGIYVPKQELGDIAVMEEVAE